MLSPISSSSNLKSKSLGSCISLFIHQIFFAAKRLMVNEICAPTQRKRCFVSRPQNKSEGFLDVASLFLCFASIKAIGAS